MANLNSLDKIAEFRPIYPQHMVEGLIRSYSNNPKQFQDDLVVQIEDHAAHYGMPFERGPLQEESEFDLLRGIKGMGEGFLSGFSTFNVGEQSSNEYERIMRSAAELAGFVGYVPAAPFKVLKAHKLAEVAKALKGKSVPMVVAKKATEITKGVVKDATKTAIKGRAGAMKTAATFLNKDIPSHVAEGAFHLGTASAVSAWQFGVDAMIESALHGAAMGGAFRGIANLINMGGAPKFDKASGKYVRNLDQQADRVLRSAASSLYDGLQSTYRGETTPEQVYHYLLGAYFGANETSATVAKKNAFMAKIYKEGQKAPEKLRTVDKDGKPIDLDIPNYNPKLTPGWEDLSPIVQKSVMEDARTQFGVYGETASMNNEIIDALKKMDKLPLEPTEEIPKGYKEVLSETGEVELTLKGDPFAKEKKKPIVDEKEGTALEGDPFAPNKLIERPEDLIKDTSSDPDMAPHISEVRVQPKAVFFAKSTLKHLSENAKSSSEKDRIDHINAVKVNELFEKRMEDKGVNSDGLIKDIEGAFEGVKLLAAQRADIRNWLLQRKLSKPVKHYSLEWTGKDLVVKDLDTFNPINVAGNSKRQREPLKPIDTFWQEARKRKGLPQRVDFSPSYIVVDHIIDNSGSYPKERTFRDAYKIGGKKDDVLLEAKRKLAAAMHKKGYYYYGGKGDAERQYWVKYHPDVDQARTDIAIKKDALQFAKKIPGFKLKDYNKAKEAFAKEFGSTLRDKSAKAAKKLTKKEALALFDRMFLSNIYWDIEMNGFNKGLKTTDKRHYLAKAGQLFKNSSINDAIKFNKRQQIWFTDGYEGNPDFLNSKINKKGLTKPELDSLKNNQWRFIMFNDAKPKGKITEKTLASEMTEATDGAILVRSDIIDYINADFGLPESGQNKSFIVSPSADHGAFLGKMMFHRASKEASDYMRETGVQFIVPESAAKDYGNRTIYDLKVNAKGQTKWFDSKTGKRNHNPEIYTWDMKDVKGSLSERQTDHMMDPQRIPKQLLTNLTQYAHQKIPQHVINDMFETLNKKSFVGNEQANKRLAEAVKKGVEGKELDELFRDIENFGIKELVEAMRSPGFEKFAGRAYSHILRINSEAMRDLVDAGEMSHQEYTDHLTQVKDFNSAIERMMRVSTDLPIFMHSAVRDYVMSAMRNFVVNQVTRPKVGNSLSLRMRPYDPWTRHKFHKMNQKGGDKLIYLDKAFESMKIDRAQAGIQGKGEITFGKLWEDYKKIIDAGKKDEVLEEFFKAVVARVPMDSLSGAHVLKFDGFTGIDGHGGIIHPKAMRALGGADLDGDKAFAFFGWKKSWRDAYECQKNEFFKDGEFKDNKKDYRDIFTIQGTPKELSYLKSGFGKYSPWHRSKMSTGAYQGRAQLGPSVVNRQTLISAHAAMMNAPAQQYVNKAGRTISKKIWDKLPVSQKKAFRADRREEIVIKHKNKNFKVHISPKTSPEELSKSRELLRASIAFPSDPLDEIGLKEKSVFFKKAFESIFNIEKPKGLPERKITSYSLRKGIFGTMHGFNQAYFGRNWDAGRRYFYSEIHERAEKVNDLSRKQVNTFLPKMTDLLKDVDWSDSPYRRINKDEIYKMYDEYNNNLKEANKLKKLLGRKTMKALMHTTKVKDQNGNEVTVDGYPGRVIKYDLWDSVERKRASQKRAKFRNIFNDLQSFEKLYLGSGKDKKNFWELAGFGKDLRKERMPKDTVAFEEFRRSQMEIMYKRATNFFINDLMDMASAKMILKAKTDGISDDFIKIVSKFNTGIKRSETALLKQAEEYSKIEGDKISTFDLRSQIEKKIRDFKENNKGLGRKLTPEESYFTDAVLLSTFGKEKMSSLNERAKGLPEWTSKTADVIHSAMMDMSGTAFTKTALNSKHVSDAAIRDFMNIYSAQFKAAMAPEGFVNAEKLTKEFNTPAKKKKSPDNTEVTIDVFEDDFSGLRNIRKEFELDAGARKLVDELIDHVRFYNNSIDRDFNAVVRGMVGKDFNALDLSDYRRLNTIFRELRDGSWYQKNFKKEAKGFPVLEKRHWAMFPRAVSDDIKRKDFELTFKEGFFQNFKGERVLGTLAKPTTHLEQLQFWAGKTGDFSSKQDEENKLALRQKFTEIGLDGIEASRSLHEIAVAERHEKLAEGKDYFKSEDNNMSRYYMRNYRRELDNVYERHDRNTLVNKTFSTSKGNFTGRQLIDKINEIYNTEGIKAFQLIVGNHMNFDYKTNKWVQVKEDPLEPYKTGKFHNRAGTEPVIDVQKFIQDIKAQYKSGEMISMDMGLDNLRRVSKSLMLQTRGLTKGMRKRIQEWQIQDTESYHPEDYWPHMMIDKKAAARSVKRALEYVESLKADKKWKQREVKKLVRQHRRLTGEWEIQDITDWGMFDSALKEIADGKAGQGHDWFDMNAKAGSQNKRSSHIPGWAKDRGVFEMYNKNLTDTFYRSLNMIMSRNAINDFYESKYKKWGPDLTNAWGNFFKDYVNGAMGNPSEIPESWLNGPEAEYMNIKGTPYAWWADSQVSKRLNHIKKMLGFKTSDKIPEELQGIDVEDLRHWSNLEAKYEMASLLAHPKSAIANIYGGTLHTVQSVGWRNWRNSRNFQHLKSTLNSKWEGMEDVNKWIREHGVLPDFILYEAGLSDVLKEGAGKEFVKDAVKLIRKDPSVKDATLRSLAKEHGLTDAIFDKAAWFMREPERILRRDAFVAHYLQAKELYGHANMDINHPFLIEKAKKGVQATQFLYSAPYRPAFSRTALGKVMTRFQLWAWNAVRFRKDVINRAHEYGWREGTVEFDRFKRMMISDMFVMAMGNVFAYSLFESALPAPYSWFQDTADWLFGDEKERDRAFFGSYPAAVAPLQLVTPPVLRLAPALFKGVVDDDYSKLSGYYIWTMFPFGRIARDLKGSAENPARTIEKMTGLPYQQFAREATRFRKEEDES